MLQTWLRGAGGLLVTSNLQFAGMEAPTCVFITNNLLEETGARSGLLRATSRLVVVSYTEDVHLEDVKKRFIVHDSQTIREKMVKRAAEVYTAAKNGDIARVKELQQLETTGNAIIITIMTLSSYNNHHHNHKNFTKSNNDHINITIN